MIPAAPIPPPTHIVTIPYLPLRRFSSRMMLAVSFAPVHPVDAKRDRPRHWIDLCRIEFPGLG